MGMGHCRRWNSPNGSTGESKSNRIQVAFDPFQDGQTHRVRLEVVFATQSEFRLTANNLFVVGRRSASIQAFSTRAQSVFWRGILGAFTIWQPFRVANSIDNPLPAECDRAFGIQSKSLLGQETNSGKEVVAGLGRPFPLQALLSMSI